MNDKSLIHIPLDINQFGLEVNPIHSDPAIYSELIMFTYSSRQSNR